jgi:hypothetical protein
MCPTHGFLCTGVPLTANPGLVGQLEAIQKRSCLIGWSDRRVQMTDISNFLSGAHSATFAHLARCALRFSCRRLRRSFASVSPLASALPNALSARLIFFRAAADRVTVDEGMLDWQSGCRMAGRSKSRQICSSLNHDCAG